MDNLDKKNALTWGGAGRVWWGGVEGCWWVGEGTWGKGTWGKGTWGRQGEYEDGGKDVGA
jgi:hypothetical protein